MAERGFNSCDCGNQKVNQNAQCDRCRYLDGDGSAYGGVISALRVLGIANISALAQEMGVNSRDPIRRALKRLYKMGRVHVTQMNPELGSKGKNIAEYEYFLVERQSECWACPEEKVVQSVKEKSCTNTILLPA